MTKQAETQTLQADPPDLSYPERPTGRKTTYSPATAEIICARLAEGEKYCEIQRTPGMPTRQTVNKWRMKIPAFDAMYIRARTMGMEAWGDDIVTIADDDTGDTDPETGKPNNANVQRSRLMIDTRWRLMQSLAAKTFGDRQTVEHTGTVEHAVTLSDRERMRRLATFLSEDAGQGVTIEHEPDTPPSLPDSSGHSAPIDKNTDDI